MAIGWEPGIGDPTAMGWFTVAAYFGAAIMCARAARSIPRSNGDTTRISSMERQFWVFALCIFLFLGVNKQLDLQSLLTAIGRATAQAQSWYGERQRYQTAFVGAVSFASVLLLTVSLWRLRRSAYPVRLAILGLAFTCAFVVIRAASFHHIDRVLGLSFLGTRWNWLIEFTGIAIVTIAAVLYRRPDSRTEK